MKATHPAGDPFLEGASARRAPAMPALPFAEPLDRLPSLYRSQPGAFLPLAQAVASMARGLLAEAGASRLPSGAGEGPALYGRAPSRDGAGTTGALARHLASGDKRVGIWCGVSVRAAGRGELEIVRPAPGSAVVAWPPGTAAASADPARIPAALLPAGVRLQAVVLWGAAPRPRISGERFRGEVIG